MKTSIYSTRFAGSGHRKITIEYSNGKLYSSVIDDMPTWDAYRSDANSPKDIKSIKRAEKRLIWLVKRKNNLR